MPPNQIRQLPLQGSDGIVSVGELILRSHTPTGSALYIIVDHAPFRVGRHANNDAQIAEPDVSGLHAEFQWSDDHWRIVDHHSTNGTFVNGQRVQGFADVQVGDIIHFATRSFQVVNARPDAEPDGLNVMQSTTQLGDSSEIRNIVELINILNQRQTLPYFQVIRYLQGGALFGWEALGRAWTGRSIASPATLFKVAAQNNVEWQLSAAFREAASDCAACRYCWDSPRGTHLFLNVHPTEFLAPGFLPSLERLHDLNLHFWFRIVIEISEAWVCHTHEMHGIVRQLRDLGMLVAYDDFGTGQARIQELINVPPDFLKIDHRLIQDLTRNRVTRDLVTVIVRACRDLKVRTIAEGVETEELRHASEDLGINLGQGYGVGLEQPAFYMSDVQRDTLPPRCPYARMNIVELVQVECRARGLQ